MQGKTWVWTGICGSLIIFIGGLANVVKVFKMQQIDGLRLEKLRGGAQERLIREREGHSPLILEEERRRKMIAAETRATPLNSCNNSLQGCACWPAMIL
jgi:hypothetical protein